ncbi:hypothetical protein BK025_00035 [Sodalis sp. TME1]|nr:hypothetical protein BK025_00035 [Sodalis sp. TME1]
MSRKLAHCLHIEEPRVFIHNGKAVTTSQAVADYFHKQHKHVLAKIESLECSVEFASANFSADVQKVDIGNGATRDSKIFTMTKDGFVFLVMGFTGKKAAAFKEAYIAEFNRMEERLHGAVAVSGVTNEILLTFRDNKIISSRPIADNEYIATLESLFEIARKADYLVIHKDDLLKKLGS